jgi:arylsulfatase
MRYHDRHAGTKQPFFLYVAYIAPHWPLHARESDIAAYRDMYRNQGWDHWREQRFARQRRCRIW